MAQECPMGGSVYGHPIALIICVERIAPLKVTMLIARSAASQLYRMKKDSSLHGARVHTLL
jgi:hypothetical protein